MKDRIIRAQYDEHTITVYQAYRPAIAIPARDNQTFVPPFKMDRMTWIKPSFLWMMYRCGWAQKEGQEHVLAIQIKREGWEWALQNACLSHFKKEVHEDHDQWKSQLEKTPVRIQWDPEKDVFLNNLNYRSIQVGLSGEAVKKYVNDWVVSITDISSKVRNMHALIKNGKVGEAEMLLPKEEVYPLDSSISSSIYASL